MSLLNPSVCVIGNSEKFIKILNEKFPQSFIIYSWRNLPFLNGVSADIIYVIGYDYSSYCKDYDSYYLSNVRTPLDFINSIANKNTIIYYIDTQHSFKKITFSRYRFAKYKLGESLYNLFFNRLRILEIPTIIDGEGSPQIHGNLVEKIVFRIAIKYGAVKAIKLSDVRDMIMMDEFVNPIYSGLAGRFLSLRRVALVDRFLRVVCG